MLDLLLDHMTSKEIAKQLGISPHTVDQRILHARQKLGAHSRSEVALAYRQVKSIYDKTIYEKSHVERSAIPLHNNQMNEAEQHLTLNDRVRKDHDHDEVDAAGYRLVPEMFTGRYGIARKFGIVALIALMMIFVASGSLTLFEQLSRILGS